MPACWCVEEIGSAAMLATKRLAGVAPEVNLRQCLTCLHQVQIRLSTLALKPGGDITSPKSKTWVSVAPQKRTYVLQKLKKDENK